MKAGLSSVCARCLVSVTPPGSFREIFAMKLERSPQAKSEERMAQGHGNDSMSRQLLLREDLPRARYATSECIGI